MKNIQWGINILFAILLGYLILGNKTIENTEVAANNENGIAEEAAHISEKMGIEIRYINSDSIYAEYEMVNDLRSNLEGRQKQYSSSLEGRLKAFEQEVVAFQKSAPTMGQFEGQQKQQELLAKEQELGQTQQDLSAKLLEMETKMQKDIRENVLSYLERFKGEGIDLVLDFSNSSSLLMAHDTLDITSEVIDSLNAKYSASKLK